MKREDRMAAEFIRKTDLFCIFIAGPIERRPVKVEIDRLTIDPREGNKFIFWRRYWTANEKQARSTLERFVTTSWQEKRGNFAGWYWLNVDDAEARLLRTASELGIVLTANSDVVKRAAEVIGRYDEKLAAMRKNGEMKPLNKAYKAYRLSNERIGKPALSYDTWVDVRLDPVIEALVSEIFRQGRQPIDRANENLTSPHLLDKAEGMLRR